MKYLTERIKHEAVALGFIAIGFSSPRRPVFIEKFTSWLAGHKNADMAWLEKNLFIRKNPWLLLPGCTTIISLAYPYPSVKPFTADGLTVSRYTCPDQDDYHKRLKKLCKEVVNVLKSYDSGCLTRICIDSAPLLERSIAYSSGIGFIGKNNMLIIPGAGSYFYLAEIFTSIPLEFEPAQEMDSQCGSCTRCLDACPTGALEGPFSIDASRCLSYLTIEYKGQIGPEEGKVMGDCFFGCDRCQEACPFNSQDNKTETILPSSHEILNMQEDEFTERFGKTALKRAGLEKIKGNIMALGAALRLHSGP
ncbi:MAG: tRNA epoxyqueuosine(34) reductase QueG [Deltaproteobacteria bacterium]|nr:tRNA epoxyqueuosine(34) reductase QueG [Deltaproteobacteria bacterium]